MRQARSGSSDPEFPDVFLQVIVENHKFLYENAKDAYDEVIELVNDAIDYVLLVAKNEEWRKNTSNSQ